MGSIITRAKRIRISRRLTQVAALVLLNLQFLNIWFANLQLSGLRVVCSPVFYCHSCPWATMACPLGVLINFSRLQLFPFITLGILGLVGTFGGRIVCGWVCPFGLLQDLIHKIPTRKFTIPHKLTYMKYVVLVVFVIAVPFLWPNAPYTFCDGCPSSVIESTIPWATVAHWKATPGLFNGFTARFWVRMSILIATLVLAVLVSRGFCRVFCPLGAIFGFFNRFSLFRFNLVHKQCNSCSACGKLCPVDIDPVAEMNTAECIRCNECTITRHIELGAK